MYNKCHFTKEDCIYELVVKSICTIKNSATGDIVIPGFISIGDRMEGTSTDGYNFSFDNILQYERKKGGYSDGKV